MWWSKLYFDKQDYELLNLVNAIVARHDTSEAGQSLFDANLHPHGIKTLALSHEMRIAHAVAQLIDSLEVGDSPNRLHALRALYDEVLNSAKTSFRRNTARVLIEIMKDLLRSHGDMQRQIYLASDFRRAARGNPHVVRELLAHYGLVEMPEDWSQLAFDHHVHDANTKGRKNPTHLIMDAWLKGIRYLTIIYYNYIEEDAAREVLQAAAIVGIHVRIGFEFTTPFRGKYVHFIWSPRIADNIEDFLNFWAEPPMQHLMKFGREASIWRQQYVFAVLDKWNEKYLLEVTNLLDIDVGHAGYVSRSVFKQFVAGGQPTMVHLAECIYNKLLPLIKQKKAELEELFDNEDESIRTKARSKYATLQSFSSTSIYNEYIIPEKNPDIASPEQPIEGDDVPEIMRLSPVTLLDWLTSIYSDSMITLNIAHLNCEEVLELLWRCQGMITHLELFNLREWYEGNVHHVDEIVELQHAINEASIPRLKHIVLSKLKKREQEGPFENESATAHDEHCLVLRDILGQIQVFKNFYSLKSLRSRMGTDATGLPGSDIGMGMVFLETLPKRAQKILGESKDSTDVPFHITLQYSTRFTPNEVVPQKSLVTRLIRAIPGMKYHGYVKEQEWNSRSSSVRHTHKGNLSLLGGVKRKMLIESHSVRKDQTIPSKKYLNSHLSNLLKVLVGFIPACIAFQYTQTWWFLAWFGPIVWFAITGVRNILQAVVAGGGLYRSTLLRWNDHVSWSRLCDSLMYTGFSVPLLEFGVRILLLQDGLGYTVANQTVLVYTIMAMVNGLYISWHNLLRGLPKEAVIGNFFRSALAIPMSILFNGIAYEVLYLSNIDNPQELLQMGAAIISKLASDTVAALIEGYADHKNNVRMRRWDYRTKFQQIFDCYVQVELLFPEDDALAKMVKPKKFLEQLGDENIELKQAIVVNSLDLMYFWMYRPRAQEVCKSLLAKLSKEERLIFGYFQLVLTQEQEVSRFFVDGMLGKHFGKPLAFYLRAHNAYLKDILPLCAVETKDNAKTTA